ncbi:MAG: CapA family protein [Lachnospiraceae bacterium]|nr:CapA family protein [Lachnospiraceae bacterium]
MGASYFFSNVKSIFDKSDFTIANLEGIFTDANSKVEKKFNIKARQNIHQFSRPEE